MSLPTFHLLADEESENDVEKKERPKNPPRLPNKASKIRKEAKQHEKAKKRNDADKPNDADELSDAEERNNAREPKVIMVVGVDFGTTYSGFATAMATSSFDDVKLNRSWPGGTGHHDKVPSVLTYEAKESGELEVKAWGYKATPSENTFTWFKLGLGKDQKPNVNDDELLNQRMGLIKCPVGMEFPDLAMDYLREFYKHFLFTLKKESSVNTFDILAYRFVIAVPAAWPDADRQLIRSCFINAGFTSRMEDEIRIISEPEAAALAVFHSYGSRFEGTNTFKVDTNVMVVDMGGGTVDLITYTIKKLKPFQVEEACVGSSAKCGSSTIDRHFLKFMKERFGEEFTKKSAKVIGPKSCFMEEFEALKRRFDSSTACDAVHLTMDWSDHEQYDAEDGEVLLKREDIEGFFKPVVENVIGLIKQQFQDTKDENDLPITAIILCGGLAESEHIQEQLKGFCKQNLPDIQVLIPKNPWAAICEGAAMSNVKSNSRVVRCRKARRSYGTVTYVPFIEGEHDEKTAIILPSGEKRAQKMYWHIKRGYGLLAKEQYRWLKNVSIQIGGNLGYQGVIEVFESDNTEPPLWKTDKGVQKLGDLTVDMSEIQDSPLKKRKCSSNSWIPGQDARTTSQKIEIGQAISPKTGSVEFAARVGRKQVGKASFAYAPKDHNESEDEVDDEGDDRDYWIHRPLRDHPLPLHDAGEDETEDSEDDEDE